MALGDNFFAGIGKKTGKTIEDFVALAIENGLGDPAIKPGVYIAWLKKDFGLGHGHAMAMSHAIRTELLKKSE